jgi:hypothetical protein
MQASGEGRSIRAGDAEQATFRQYVYQELEIIRDSSVAFVNAGEREALG